MARKAAALVVALAFAAGVAFAAGSGAKDRDESTKDEGKKEKTREELAVEAALAWLAFVDKGEYGESWDEAAALFKGAVAKEAWERTVKGVRDPMGKMKSRELKAATFMTEMPGAPDGEYVVIQFNTSFENKKEAVETVTPMFDKDGRWRVSGYYIK